MNEKQHTSVDQRLSGSHWGRFWQELLRNSGQFPIGIIFIEALREGWQYIGKPDLYVLIPAALAQAYWLTLKEERPPWQRFVGNLIAPALYTLGEMAIEGLVFFQSPHHTVYWGFAFFIGALQALQNNKISWLNQLILVLENVARALILFTIYAIFETYSNPNQTGSLTDFFGDPSHILIGLVALTLGISAGLADVSARNFMTVLRKTASQLKIYSEWLLGRDLLGRALNNPESMRLTRQERTILFMDIRGFTRWSEPRPPEEVAALLNRYYCRIEEVFDRYQVIKYKFTADEVMAVFILTEDALSAAHDLRQQVENDLQKNDLGAGIGIHTGTLVEGLLGGKNIWFYDVIGDTVNTAQRIESAAGAGEIWVSVETVSKLNAPQIKAQKEISVKGKELPIQVYSIL